MARIDTSTAIIEREGDGFVALRNRRQETSGTPIETPKPLISRGGVPGTVLVNWLGDVTTHLQSRRLHRARHGAAFPEHGGLNVGEQPALRITRIRLTEGA